MKITIDLMQLILALLALGGVVLVVYLIITLARLQQTLREANRIMAEARGPVSDTLRKLPSLMDQVSEIGANVEKLTTAMNEDVPVMLKDVRQVTTSAREGVDAVSGAVSGIGGTVQDFTSSFRSHSGTVGTAASVISDIIKVIQIFRTPKKSKTIFGRKKRR